MAPEPRWTRSPAVLWRSLPDGVLVLGPDSPHPLAVLGSAARCWDLLDEPITLDELTRALADGHDTTQVRADLLDTLDQLRSVSAVTVDPAP